ncbi:putative cell wall protein [Typha latifolia]|uniref:putative cell wall protein n=1 Tax=Typha latifolia TaxID=4733 RepID=UPI003C2F36CE
MAYQQINPSLSPLLLFLVLFSFCNEVISINGGRNVPAQAGTNKKQTECSQEGSVLVPGVGRYMAGSTEIPDISAGRDLDHSIPAAVSGQYLPGADDTFVPNPGFEVPNPLHP